MGTIYPQVDSFAYGREAPHEKNRGFIEISQTHCHFAMQIFIWIRLVHLRRAEESAIIDKEFFQESSVQGSISRKEHEYELFP